MDINFESANISVYCLITDCSDENNNNTVSNKKKLFFLKIYYSSIIWINLIGVRRLNNIIMTAI